MPGRLVYFVRPRFVEDFSATFADVAEAGIRDVVLGARMGNIDFLDRGHLSTARGAMERLGLRAVACHGLLSGHRDLNEPEGSIRALMIESHCRLMDHMAEIGCRTYVCHPGPARPGCSRGAQWALVRKALDKLSPRAESLDLHIALENLPPGYLGDNADELTRFADGYGCAHVGICYDSGHAHIAEDAASVLKTLAPLLVTAHIHDNDGISDDHRIPGLGTIDWATVVPLLDRCPRLIHVETEAFNTEKWAHRNVLERYCEVLRQPTHAPAALPRAGGV